MLNDKNTVVVFGMGPAGLFISRQLKRQGYKIIGVGKKDDVGQYSKSLSDYLESEDIHYIYSYLESIITIHKAKAYICSDQYLTLMIEECPEMFGLLDFKEPTVEQLCLIANKERLMSESKNLGVHFPNEYYITENTDLTCLLYPVAIKPNIKRGKSPFKKVTIIKDSSELFLFLKTAKEYGIDSNQLIIQQYIAGDNEFEYGYGGYFKNGKPICDICFRQLRQYPQGVCCYILEVTDSEKEKKIKEQPQAFAKAMNYSGFMQFDIKEDANTGVFYSLDINPRPWGSVSLLGAKSLNHSIFNGNDNKQLPICWRFPVKEIFSLKNKNNVGYSRLKELKGNVKYQCIVDLYDKNDVKPFLMQPVIMLRKLIK